MYICESIFKIFKAWIVLPFFNIDNLKKTEKFRSNFQIKKSWNIFGELFPSKNIMLFKNHCFYKKQAIELKSIIFNKEWTCKLYVSKLHNFLCFQQILGSCNLQKPKEKNCSLFVKKYFLIFTTVPTTKFFFSWNLQ